MTPCFIFTISTNLARCGYEILKGLNIVSYVSILVDKRVSLKLLKSYALLKKSAKVKYWQQQNHTELYPNIFIFRNYVCFYGRILLSFWLHCYSFHLEKRLKNPLRRLILNLVRTLLEVLTKKRKVPALAIKFKFSIFSYF